MPVKKKYNVLFEVWILVLVYELNNTIDVWSHVIQCIRISTDKTNQTPSIFMGQVVNTPQCANWSSTSIANCKCKFPLVPYQYIEGNELCQSKLEHGAANQCLR